MLAASHEELTDSKRDSASANGSLFLTLHHGLGKIVEVESVLGAELAAEFALCAHPAKSPGRAH
jgi:hypothetical protein